MCNVLMTLDDGHTLSSPAGMDSHGQGLHQGALLQAHVIRQLVAEVSSVYIMSNEDIVMT